MDLMNTFYNKYVKFSTQFLLLLFLVSCFTPITERRNLSAYKKAVCRGENQHR